MRVRIKVERKEKRKKRGFLNIKFFRFTLSFYCSITYCRKDGDSDKY